MEEQEYSVECIMNSRFRRVKDSHILEYLIHWEGYDHSEDSWTPATEFEDDDEVVVEFYKKNPNKPKAGMSPSKFKPTANADIRNFFGGGTAKKQDKENEPPKVTKKLKADGKGAKPKKDKVEQPSSKREPVQVKPPKPRKKTPEDDKDDDFVMDDEQAGPSSDDEDAGSSATADEDIASEAVDEDDLVSEEGEPFWLPRDGGLYL